MVDSGPQIKQAWVVVPVLLLLVVGGVIAVQSGVAASGSGYNLRQLGGTLARVCLRIVGYVVALLILQYYIGLRPSLGW